MSATKITSNIYSADGNGDRSPVGIWADMGTAAHSRAGEKISSAQNDKVSYVNWLFFGGSLLGP